MLFFSKLAWIGKTDSIRAKRVRGAAVTARQSVKPSIYKGETMDDINLNNQGCGKAYNARLHYENTAADLELGEYWKRYFAELAFELCGKEIEIGDALIKKKELRAGNPLKILQEAAESMNSPELFKLHDEKSKTVSSRRIWNAQIRICLPMIEMERCGYITAQYGLLLRILSSEYWDGAASEYKVLFTPQKEGEVGDPYDLDLATLRRLPYMEKRLVMYGTVSYAPFLRMHDNDKERLAFTADLQDRLTHFRLCSEEELEKLFAGHEKFLDR